MKSLYRVGQSSANLSRKLPPGLRAAMVDSFFCYAPVWVIRVIWKEIAGYFKHYTPARGQTVVDAGTWTGHFTLIAARLVGPQGRVIAIEPQREMAQRLEARMKHLGFHNVTVVNAALFDQVSQMDVSKNPTAGFNVFDRPTEGEKETVVLRTLDDIVTSLGVKQVHFVKMDIEGAELEALAGAKSMLGSIRPFFAIASYHIRDGVTTSGPVEKILSGYNYSAQTGHPTHLTTWGWPKPSAT